MHDSCSFSGCDKTATRKGLCVGHYQQQQRGKTLVPLAIRPPRSTKASRIESVWAVERHAAAIGLTPDALLRLSDMCSLTRKPAGDILSSLIMGAWVHVGPPPG